MAKTKSDAPLRIVKLVAENFKRLVAVEITPDGSVVEISGPNEAGKSSIMDAISAALGGEDGRAKAWHIEVAADGLDAEIAYLKSDIYCCGDRPTGGRISTVTPRDRFTVRG